MIYTTMTQLTIWFTLAFFFNAVFCLNNVQQTSLYFKPLNSNRVVEWGVVEYDTFASNGFSSLKVLDNSESPIGCIGTKKDDFECQTSVNGTDGTVILFLNDSGDIENINFKQSQTAENKVVIIRETKQGILPKLKEPVVLVNNEVPEAQKEKTVLEKYGIYIIPLVLLLLLSGKGE